MISIFYTRLLTLFLLCNVIAFQAISQCKYHPKTQKYTGFSSKNTGTSPNPVISDEHYTREMHYDVKHLKLSLEASNTTTEIKNALARTFAQVVSPTALDTFAFELDENMKIDSLKVNGLSVSSDKILRSQYEVNVLLPSALPAGSMIEVAVYYHGIPSIEGGSAFGSGVTNRESPSWGTKATWTLSQPYAAYQWFPVKQVLSDKFDSVFVSITMDSTLKAGSNGLLKKIETHNNGKHTYHWQTFYPINYYLVSYAVSDYQDYTIYAYLEDTKDSIKIQNYIYDHPDILTRIKKDVNETKPLIEYFSKIFGRYPFYQEKYGHCMAPISGGMEHQTMTTQGFFAFTLTAHELAHQWFGDNVTCATWNDLYLNEGFASYSEYLAIEGLDPKNAMPYIVAEQAQVRKELGGSVFCPNPEDVGRLFDSRLTYTKGACVLHTLRFTLNNDSLFWKSLQKYQQLYGNSVATTQNLKQVFESVSKLNLDNYINEWIMGEGFPVFSVLWNDPQTLQNGKLKRNLILNVNQLPTMPDITPFFHTDYEVLVRHTNGNTQLIRLTPNEPQQIFSILLEDSTEVETIIWDPNNWVVDSLDILEKDLSLARPDLSQSLQGVIYPNPTNGQIYYQITNISAAHNTLAITLLDATGRNIQDKKIMNTVMNTASTQTNNKLELFDLSPYPKGMYFIHIQDTQNMSNSQTYKVVKN